ncbi:MAG: TonB-dependent receptor plug domain-containing protein, partial [Saprospiraceae bacterium]|nr:TonB-dependent receptor plug domain-containing protein [Saprospiraceae bacterium]
MQYKYIVTMVLAFLVSGLFAQQQAIRILDLENALPISFATFEYGDQTGTADAQGIIHLTYTTGNSLTLSHINYGTWTMKDHQVQTAINEQVTFRKNIAVNLYPATIIAVRPQGLQPDEEITLQFDDRLAHDGASLLKQMPAISTIRKGGNYGFDPVFRGFKYDQLNIVLNGAQSATAACPNRMDPPTSQMAPNMMDRIEVLKGPHALRYGTGFGATINFIPTRLRFTPATDFYGRVSGGYESNGNVLRSESQIGITGSNYDFSVLGSWSQGDDYKDGNENVVPADFTRGSFGANLGLKLTNQQKLRISGLYNRARDADFPALPMDLREDDTWLFNARHDILINGKHLQSWNTTVFGSFVEHLMDNLLKPLEPRMMNASTAATTYNYGARTESVWNAGKGKLYAGL